MCFAVPCEDYKVNPVLAERSTRSSSCMPITSRTRRPRRCALPARRAPTRSPAIAAGIAAVGPGAWRRQRGGAEDARRGIGTVDKIREFIAKVKDKNSDVRSDGLWPPGLQELRPARQDHAEDCHDRAERAGHVDDPILEGRAWNSRTSLSSDQYFIDRKLYPNVDFYSGITLKAMGFPDLDVHRAVRGRAHRRLDRAVDEMIAGPGQKIGRPRQLYTGVTRRDYSDGQRG